MKVKEKKFLILMIYTFSMIVMIIGITFSYFTTKTRSNKDALSIKSGHLFLTLDVESKYSGHKLIPLADSNVIEAYNNKCFDDYGNGVCVAYDIIITNDTVKQDVMGNIDFNVENINNLSYLVLDEESNIYQKITKVEENTKNMPLGSNFILDSAFDTGTSTKRKFTLVIWLSDYDSNQLGDMGGNFTASITYNSVYGQKLSSVISGYEKENN